MRSVTQVPGKNPFAVAAAASSSSSSSSFSSVVVTATGVASGSCSSSSASSSSFAVTKTVIVGLNAAFQKRFILSETTSRLVPGSVHRASQVQEGVGGKGQDVAIALSCLLNTENDNSNSNSNSGREDSLLLAQFVGQGSAGDVVCQLLHEALSPTTATSSMSMSMSPMECTVRSSAPLRTCTSIVAGDGVTTELVEPSGLILPGEYQELMEKLEHYITTTTKTTQTTHPLQHYVDALCIMGSMPPGCPDDTYSKIYDIMNTQKLNQEEEQKEKREEVRSLLCLIDSVVGLEPLWNKIVTTKKKKKKEHHCTLLSSSSLSSPLRQATQQTLLKINVAELYRLADYSSAQQTNNNDGNTSTTKTNISLALEALFRKFPQASAALDAIAITDGSHPAYLATNFAALDDNDDEKRPQQRLQLFQVNVPSLSSSSNGIMEDSTTRIFPIGAGDAVAAGTLAAWKSFTLLQNQKNCGCYLPRELHDLLLEKKREITDYMIRAGSDGDNPKALADTATLVASFCFGICCGTASCLQEQNSVLKVADVKRFFINHKCGFEKDK